MGTFWTPLWGRREVIEGRAADDLIRFRHGRQSLWPQQGWWPSKRPWARCRAVRRKWGGGRQHLGARGVDPAERFAPLNSGKSSQGPLVLPFLSRPGG